MDARVKPGHDEEKDHGNVFRARASIFFRAAPGIRQFAIQGFPVLQAAAKKLGPWRHGDILRYRFRQQSPQLRMVPAEIVSAAVASFADSIAQAHHFRNERFPGHAY
jgi:hypothetical protein